jgi:hypothetical protein
VHSIGVVDLVRIQHEHLVPDGRSEIGSEIAVSPELELLLRNISVQLLFCLGRLAVDWSPHQQNWGGHGPGSAESVEKLMVMARWLARR